MKHFKVFSIVILLSISGHTVAGDLFKKIIVFSGLIHNAIAAGPTNAAACTPYPLNFAKKGALEECLSNNTLLADNWYQNSGAIENIADKLGSKPFCQSEVLNITRQQTMNIFSNDPFLKDDTSGLLDDRAFALYRAATACSTQKICTCMPQSMPVSTVLRINVPPTPVADPVMAFQDVSTLEHCLQPKLAGSWFQQKGIAHDMAGLLAGKLFYSSAARGTAHNLVTARMVTPPAVLTKVGADLAANRTAVLYSAVQACQMPQSNTNG